MKRTGATTKVPRRQFFLQVFPVSAMAFLGCPLLSDLKLFENRENLSFQGKAKDSFCRTYEEAFEWRYNYYIEKMGTLANYLGRERLIELIKKSGDDLNRLSAQDDLSLTLKDFAEPYLKSDFFKNTIDLETIQYTDKIWELKIRKCLWAETFKRKNAADLGYATVCYADFSSAKAFSPKLTLKRPDPTIMEGGELCHEFYIWEG